MKPLRFVLLVALGLVVSSVALKAEKIPALLLVSPLIPPAERSVFLDRRTKIQERVRDFKKASDLFNKQPAAKQTDKEFDDLTTEQANCVIAVNQFNDAIIARMAALGAADTSVVDTRFVPSGLPPDVDTALAGLFAGAPPGVGDRIRKGFQAVMAHDWKVAAAWFEDALNRDPGNPALKSLLAAVRSSPTTPPSPQATAIVNLYAKGYDALFAGERPRAIASFEEALRRDPGASGSIRSLVSYLKTQPPVTPARDLQLPAASDLEFMHDVQGASPASAKRYPTFIIGKDGQPIEVPPDSKQDVPIYIKGRDGQLLQAPLDLDNLSLFPEAAPAPTPFLQLLLNALKSPPKNDHPQVSSAKG